MVLHVFIFQINFLTPHDSAGFYILKNDRDILSCVVTSLSHASNRPDKSNTCYTGGAEYLEVGDKITVKDFSDYAFSKFSLGKSFFGAIRLTTLWYELWILSVKINKLNFYTVKNLNVYYTRDNLNRFILAQHSKLKLIF